MTATYGLLPADYRFSRALIVLTTIWTVFLTVGIRLLLHFWKRKSLSLDESAQQKLTIVGSPEEGKRVQNLLLQAGAQKNLLGFISSKEEYDQTSYLGSIYDLDDLCLLYTSPSPRDATLSRMPSSA